MSLFDVNGDGFITIEEWCIIQQYSSSSSLFSILQTAQTKASCPNAVDQYSLKKDQQAFPLIDTNGNGEIDPEELKTYLIENQSYNVIKFTYDWEFYDLNDKGYYTLADLCELYSVEGYASQYGQR